LNFVAANRVNGSMMSGEHSGVSRIAVVNTWSDGPLRCVAARESGAMLRPRRNASKVGWRLDLNFGLSKTRGFYLRTDDPMPGRATTGELTVSADLHLPQHVEGDIAFLRLKIANNHSTATPDMHLGLSADIKGGQTDAADGGAVKLDYQSFTASDPQNPADVAVKLDANVNLDLHLTTTIHLPDSLNIPSNDGSGPQLPELSTDFLLTWDFGTGFSLNGGVDASSGTTPLAIQFNNVSLDLGQFFGSFLGPIVKEVQRFTKPLQPVLDTVNAPIPGISDLSELAGAGKVTMIDFFEHASGADLTLVKRLIKLIDLINALPTSGSSIVLGSFSVSGSGAEGPTPTGDNADSLIASKSPAFSDSTSVLAQAGERRPHHERWRSRRFFLGRRRADCSRPSSTRRRCSACSSART